MIIDTEEENLSDPYKTESDEGYDVTVRVKTTLLFKADSNRQDINTFSLSIRSLIIRSLPDDYGITVKKSETSAIVCDKTLNVLRQDMSFVVTGIED